MDTLIVEILDLYDAVTISNTGDDWRPYEVKVEDGDNVAVVEAATVQEGLEEALAIMAEKPWGAILKYGVDNVVQWFESR